MLLELIFTLLLKNITQIDTHTHKIPSSRAPVGAKKLKKNVLRLCKDLFDRINEDKSPDAQYSVEVRQSS